RRGTSAWTGSTDSRCAWRSCARPPGWCRSWSPSPSRTACRSTPGRGSRVCRASDVPRAPCTAWALARRSGPGPTGSPLSVLRLTSVRGVRPEVAQHNGPTHPGIQQCLGPMLAVDVAGAEQAVEGLDGVVGTEQRLDRLLLPHTGAGRSGVLHGELGHV